MDEEKQITSSDNGSGSSAGNYERKIEEFTFADGTKWNANEFENKYKIYVKGTSDNDNLVGSNTLRGNYIQGDSGHDIISGSSASDTYFYDKTDGIDTITESGGNDKLKINANADDIILIKNGNDLRMMLNEFNMVDIKEWFTSEDNHIEKLETSDGMALYNNQIGQLVQAMASFEAEKGVSWLNEIHNNNEEAVNIAASYWVSNKVEESKE